MTMADSTLFHSAIGSKRQQFHAARSSALTRRKRMASGIPAGPGGQGEPALSACYSMKNLGSASQRSACEQIHDPKRSRLCAAKEQTSMPESRLVTPSRDECSKGNA